MLSSQKRNNYFNLSLIPRLDSRLLLRALIAFNIVLAVYNIITLQSNTRSNKSSPCVIVINTSKESTNAHKSVDKSETDPKVESEVTSVDNRVHESSDANNKLLDKENIELKNLKLNEEIVNELNEDKIWWSTESRASYSVLKNYIPSEEKPDPLSSVTLTTQGTFPFLYHIENLCRRWDGHISLAVYAPGHDFPLVINLIYYLRKCKDFCVKSKTSWHMVYDTAFGPKSNASFPYSYVEDMNFDCSLTFDNIVDKFNTSFRSDHSLPYPINVVRNVARLNAQTKYIFASDIELYPSVGIVSAFLQLLQREKSGLVALLSQNNPHVYVIPIFEVKAGTDPPKNKEQLRALIKSGNAIFFHKWVCDACQNFPDRNQWIDIKPENNSLNVFRVTKRQRSRNTWEPLYIGTNSEPFYDERLTWDGKRDKMSQMYEMCLKNYDLAILDNAFLVHAPGIKHIDPKETKKRLPFIKRNNMVYNTILSKLRKKYGTKNKC